MRSCQGCSGQPVPGVVSHNDEGDQLALITACPACKAFPDDDVAQAHFLKNAAYPWYQTYASTLTGHWIENRGSDEHDTIDEIRAFVKLEQLGEAVLEALASHHDCQGRGSGSVFRSGVRAMHGNLDMALQVLLPGAESFRIQVLEVYDADTDFWRRGEPRHVDQVMQNLDSTIRVNLGWAYQCFQALGQEWPLASSYQSYAALAGGPE